MNACRSLSEGEKKRRFLALQEPFPSLCHSQENVLLSAHSFLCRTDFHKTDEHISILLFLFALFSQGKYEGGILSLPAETVLRLQKKRFLPDFRQAVSFYRRCGLEISFFLNGKKKPCLQRGGSVVCVARKGLYRGVRLFAEKIKGLPCSLSEKISLFLRADFRIFLPNPPDCSPRFSACLDKNTAALFETLALRTAEEGLIFKTVPHGFFSVAGFFSRNGKPVFSAENCDGGGFALKLSFNRRQTALVYCRLSSLSPAAAEEFLHPADCLCPVCCEMPRQVVYRFRVWNAPFLTRCVSLRVRTSEDLSDALVLLGIK